MSSPVPNQDVALAVGVPTILLVVPSSGPIGGGNPVVLIGTNLDTVTSVTFGGTAATIVAQPPTGTVLIVTAPAHAAGAVPVVATNPSGASVPAGYTYLVPLPPLAFLITPVSGPAAGGTSFTIIGANLTGASVTFNGTAATGVTVAAGGAVLTGVTPAGTAGPATVVVTTPGGTATVPGGYLYA
ncbi:IPT/TIG domain-containing protein [Streptomyces sp. NA02950]|uniref:IPT/TIG domain-containing protein n=1 Tax=Streptomyces sp. NA02950 TaxID=2742137 RepID=UPI0015923985|nr:IPT/TIG domain-containing protein [Streptomyces sp. NA02950]QKV95136.1 IPT/TIG domain-containing protein [Streptomyces sp. NA02950]